MAAIVSNNFRSLNAKGFIEDVRSEQSNIYIGVGKSTAWQDSSPSLQDFTDSQAPLPVDTIDDVNEARSNMVGLKLIKNNEVSHVVPRYDWTAGTVYSPWDSDDPNIFENSENPFYVLTKDFKVYKCLDRLSSTTAASDVPTKVQAAPFETADGYKWKYMYTIIASDSEKFLTRSYMPVKTLTIETEAKCADGQSEFAVNAEHTIELLNENPKITVGQKVTMTGQAGGNLGTTVVLVTGISGKFVTLSASTSAYTVDSSTVLTFGDFEDTNPLYDQQQAQKNSLGSAGAIDRIEVTDSGTGFSQSASDLNLIASQINIVGDGTGAAVTGNSSIQTASNTVTRVIPSTGGSGYSVAQVSFIEGVLSTGTGLKARAVIAPPSGHGVDPVAELGAFYVSVNTQISGVDDIDIANNQDFRQITILKNPTVNGKIETKAEAQSRGNNRGTFRATKFLTFNIGTVSVLDAVRNMSNLVQNGNDVLLKGSEDASNAEGVIPRAYVTNVDLTDDGRGDGKGRIYYVQNSLTGYNTFPTSDDVTYSNSAAPTASTSGITLNGAGGTDYNKQSGEILFIENRDAIQRSSTQIEDIKLILEF